MRHQAHAVSRLLARERTNGGGALSFAYLDVANDLLMPEVQEPSSMLNLNTLIPAVAAILFVIAIGALFPWISEISGSKTWRGRNGLVDQRRKLILIGLDDVELFFSL